MVNIRLLGWSPAYTSTNFTQAHQALSGLNPLSTNNRHQSTRDRHHEARRRIAAPEVAYVGKTRIDGFFPANGRCSGSAFT